MRRALTLVQLLVVVAIIAVLVGILFPAFAQAREKGRQATCLSNQKQIAAALQMYVNDSRGQFPGVKGVEDERVWRDALLPHVGSDRVFDCPSGNQDPGPNNTEIGYNFELYGAADNDVQASTRAIVTVDARRALVVGKGDVDAMRHRSGFIASFWDGHSKLIVAAKTPTIFGSGDMGSAYLYGVTAQQILFSDGDTATGNSAPVRDGTPVLLVSESEGPIVATVSVAGEQPTEGLVPGKSDLRIDGGMARAFALACASLGGQRVTTTYVFGTPSKGAVTVAVEP